MYTKKFIQALLRSAKQFTTTQLYAVVATASGDVIGVFDPV